MPGYLLKICLLLILLSSCLPGMNQDKYPLHYHFADKDTTVSAFTLGLQSGFPSQAQCIEYTGGLVNQLRRKGYMTASVDSLSIDSTSASLWLYLGEQYRLSELIIPENEKQLVEQAGWPLRTKEGMFDFSQIERGKENLLKYLENNGYPFSKIQVDSITIDSGKVTARLQIERGPLYKIDSIRVSGNARIRNYFLQKYLDIKHGSLYRRDKLDMISPRLLELPYLKESRKWDMTMLGTGSTLNFYLEPRKSSQVNLLIGFLPDNSQINGKLLMTGEADVNLRNALGGGETILVNWQQLQVKSPRLKLAFQQPYMFRSSFGLDFSFDLFKKDSSFLNLDFRLGVLYMLSARQSGKIFYQNISTNLLTIDTARIKLTKNLPQYLDVSTSNLGLEYSFNNTDYRFNPRKGNDLTFTMSGGIRRIRRNSNITNLGKTDPGDGFNYESLYDTLPAKSYILSFRISGAHYFKMGKQSALKTALQGGLIQTKQPFRNEIFQIGGYRLLRGFDEQSIFASRYMVGTLEYRYLIGLNAFLFGFTDIGYAGNRSFTENTDNSFLGFGLGMNFETKAGIFNLTYAAGKRNDLPFSLRQSKIHFGFVSLF